jgi:hypothetical protein
LRLVERGDPESIRSRRDRCRRHHSGAVTIGIGFNDGHQRHVRTYGPRHRSHIRVDRVEIDQRSRCAS